MLPFRNRLFLVIGLTTLLAAGTAPAWAASVSAGGPWTYTRGPIICKFSGSHGALNNKAYARTQDYNDGCASLMARLKSNPGGWDSGWYTSIGSPAIFDVVDPLSGSTAISSEHRAQNGWDSSFSQIARPHAW